MTTTDTTNEVDDVKQTIDDDKRSIEQAEMWQRYLEQQAKLSCPGCGESPFIG